jgi:hypothetical protein
MTWISKSEESPQLDHAVNMYAISNFMKRWWNGNESLMKDKYFRGLF